MDIIDIKIMESLQKNARISISEMSKEVQLSLSAISERLKKLENSGIILQYTTILDATILKKELTVIMNISLSQPEYTAPFIDCIQSENDILECYYITGEYDYSLKIVTHNTATLEQILNKIKRIPGIQKTQTNVIFSTIKQLYSSVPISNE